MKKEKIIVGIMLVLITVGLSGCTNDSGGNSKNKFVGTWTATSDVNVAYYDIIKIYNDGLASLIYHTPSSGDGTDAATWSVDAETKMLTFNLTSREGVYRYNYSFSNDETLVLTRTSSTTSFTYKKS